MDDPPTPEFVLRAHAGQINSLSFSRDGRFLASGDADGHVCVWSLSTFRPLLFWRAHGNSVLTVIEWGASIVTHGRDNLIHLWDIPEAVTSVSGPAPTAAPSLAKPSAMTPRCSLPTNALAYCKAAFLPLPGGEGLVATPAALSDELVDICHLPSCTRVSRSVGKDAWPVNDKTGTVMALELILRAGGLALLAAYEDGRLALFTSSLPDPASTARHAEAEGWTLQWYEHGHREPIMGLAIAPDDDTAWTVGADRFVSSYRLARHADKSTAPRLTRRETAHAGRAAVCVRDDGRLIAVAGWDGRVRVHGARTYKALAVLECHRDSVYAVAFAPTLPARVAAAEQDGRPRSWLAAAGKDARISLWELYPVHDVVG